MPLLLASFVLGAYPALDTGAASFAQHRVLAVSRGVRPGQHLGCYQLRYGLWRPIPQKSQ
jgi:hypothetical protein